MSSGLVVKQSAQQIDERTSHAIVAAQLRGEAREEAVDPRSTVRAVAKELEAIDLDPDLDELGRRYRASETTIPTWLRERGHDGAATNEA